MRFDRYTVIPLTLRPDAPVMTDEQAVASIQMVVDGVGRGDKPATPVDQDQVELAHQVAQIVDRFARQLLPGSAPSTRDGQILV